MSRVSWAVNNYSNFGKLLCALLLILYGTYPSAESKNDTAQIKSYEAELPQSGYKLFTDKQNRFSAAQPLGWEVNYQSPPTDGVIFIVQPTEDGSENASVSIMVTPPASNIIEVADAADNYLANQPGVEAFKLTSDQNVSLSGAVGIERVVTFALNGVTLYVRTLYLQHSAQTFALSFTTGVDNVDNMRSAFEQMIRNFTIL